MKWLKARFSEPSTWAGLSALVPTVFTVATTGLNPAAIATLAGGDWGVISSILEQELVGQDHTLVIYGP